MQLKWVDPAFMIHSVVSVQDAVYKIFSLPMQQLSKNVVFIETDPKNEKIGVLKYPKSLLKV